MKKVLFALAAFIVLAAWTTNSNMNDGGRKFTMTLTGAEEVGGGDPNATGTAVLILNQGQGTLTYELTVSGIDGTVNGAHIHEAPAGFAGPVVIALTPPVNGTSSGVITVSKELIKEIRQNPEDYYVNVHSSVYPGGAVRGQLSK